MTPWTAACQAPLPFTVSWSLLRLKSIESVMLYNHLIFCCPPSFAFNLSRIWFFSNESGLCIRWPNSSISLHKTLSVWQPRTKMERGQTIQGFSKCVPSVLTTFQGAHKMLFTFVNFIVPYVCVLIFPKGYVTCGIPAISFDWTKTQIWEYSSLLLGQTRQRFVKM